MKKKWERKFKQKGVAAIEFALIFPVLFLMLYGLLSYSLIFAMQHSLSLAAAEGGRAAVRFVSKSDDISVRVNAACRAAQNALSWMASIGIPSQCTGNANSAVSISILEKPCPSTASSSAVSSVRCIDISAIYAYSANPLIPKIVPVPSKLTGHSFTQIALSF